MTGHLTPEAVAEYDVGLLPAAEAAAAAAHLDACPACARVLADVRAVPARLSAAAPGPMPASVVARLEAALAMEAAVTVAPREGVPEGAVLRSGGASPGVRPRRSTRLLAGLAAAATVLGVLALAVPYLRGSGTVGESTSAPAGGSAPQAPAASQAPSTTPPSLGARYAGPLVVSTDDRSYTRARLAAQVGSVLAAPPVLPGRRSLEAGPPEDRVVRYDEERLRRCLAALGVTVAPRLVDPARFEGRAAIVIVVPRADDGTHGRVSVVADNCGADPPTLLAEAEVSLP